MAVAVTDRITRGASGAAPFAIAWEEDLKLGNIMVADTDERDNLPTWKRRAFMSVYVIEDDTYFRLGADTTIPGQVWTEQDFGVPSDVLTENEILDEDGFIKADLIRNVFLNDNYVVDDEAEMLALSTVTGNFVIRTDTGGVFVKLNNDEPAELADFAEVTYPGAVLSVNGDTGAVSVTITNLLAVGANLTAFNSAVAAAPSVSTLSSAVVLLNSEIADLGTTKADVTYTDNHILGYEMIDPDADSLVFWNDVTDQIEYVKIGAGFELDGGFINSIGAGSTISNLDDLADVTLAAPAEGQVLSFMGGAWVNSTINPLMDGDKGDITVSSTGSVWTIDTQAVTYSKIQNGTGLSILGRSANSAGANADIVGTDGQILRVSGTTLGFGNNDLDTLLFKNNEGIDVIVTGGSDVLNVGTSNADIINIGWSGAEVNIFGTKNFIQTTNTQIKDALITLNKGGTAGSAVSTGFEIEENSIITGYFATNGTRNGYDFKAPAITGVATFSLASLSANRTFTLPNTTGTLALVASTWATTGSTTITTPTIVGDPYFQGRVLVAGSGKTLTSDVRFEVFGIAGGTDYIARFRNGDNIIRFTVRDDGEAKFDSANTNCFRIQTDSTALLNQAYAVRIGGGTGIIGGSTSGWVSKILLIDNAMLTGNTNQIIRAIDILSTITINHTGATAIGFRYNPTFAGSEVATHYASYWESGMHFIKNHGTTVPAVPADGFIHYADDIVAGNSAPHFKTEVGDIIKLYKYINADFANTVNTGDTDTDDLIDALVAALTAHGLIATS